MVTATTSALLIAFFAVFVLGVSGKRHNAEGVEPLPEPEPDVMKREDSRMSSPSMPSGYDGSDRSQETRPEFKKIDPQVLKEKIRKWHAHGEKKVEEHNKAKNMSPEERAEKLRRNMMATRSHDEIVAHRAEMHEKRRKREEFQMEMLKRQASRLDESQLDRREEVLQRDKELQEMTMTRAPSATRGGNSDSWYAEQARQSYKRGRSSSSRSHSGSDGSERQFSSM